jgi:F420-dependent oxidoreductase-like protein
MRFGIDVSQHRLEWSDILDRVRFAEEAGFDGAWVFDHFQPLYGEGPGPCLEGWTLLAALAAVTERIRLGTLVTGITYRHPSILATEAVTVDQVSGGRLELAVGAAWNEGEHRQLGIPFPRVRERAERLEEGIQVMKLLMTGEDVSFDGRHYRLDHATYRPRPVQQPHPPVWIGARGEQLMLPIVARQADVWHSYGNAELVGRLSRRIDDLAEQAGRDPKEILRAGGLSISEPWGEVRRRVEQLQAVGIGYLVVSWPKEGRSRMEEFVQEVMPGL